jgi:hypothetical protein
MSKREEDSTPSSAPRGLSRTRISRTLTPLNTRGLAIQREFRNRTPEQSPNSWRVFQSCLCQRIIRAFETYGEASFVVTF